MTMRNITLPLLISIIAIACYGCTEDTEKFVEIKCNLNYKVDDMEKDGLYSKRKSYIDSCKKSGMEFTHQWIFLFPKQALKADRGWVAEMERKVCWKAPETHKISVNATATVISFVMPDDTFNISRDTLKGGWGVKRDWICVVNENVKKSNNKI